MESVVALLSCFDVCLQEVWCWSHFLSFKVPFWFCLGMAYSQLFWIEVFEIKDVFMQYTDTGLSLFQRISSEL